MINNKISTNIIYNVLNQAVSLVVPLILSPYIARVLSAELIGDYSFALANSSYFVLIETLGLPLYGMLKVSANRNDKDYISAMYAEITVAKIFLMFFCVSIYMIMFVFFEKTSKVLCCIMVSNIISAGIDSTWFLMGVEDFKTTALRNIVVRIITILLIFLFVKSKEDFLIYAIIMQGSNLISYIVLLPQVKKYVIAVKINYQKIFMHIKNSMLYFVPGIINTIFTSADKTVLGVFSNKYEVGVYEEASKITTMCISVINSISNVILPRVTYLNNNANKDESKKFLLKTLRFASIISFAISAGILCVADEFVPVFFGNGYEKSSVLIKIMALNVLVSILSNYLGQQCLIANNKQKEYNIAISSSAILNVIMNLCLVHAFQSVGVSFASTISGIAIFILIILYSRDTIRPIEIFDMTWKSLISAIMMIFISYYIPSKISIYGLLLKVFLCAISYFLTLIICREKLIIDIIKDLKGKNK